MPRKDKTSGFFRDMAPPPSTAQERTDAAVKLIRETEADTRAELTARLRAARIAHEGTGSASAAPPTRAKARD